MDGDGAFRMSNFDAIPMRGDHTHVATTHARRQLAQRGHGGGNGWPNYCRKQPEGSNTAINICYGEITCEEKCT